VPSASLSTPTSPHALPLRPRRPLPRPPIAEESLDTSPVASRRYGLEYDSYGLSHARASPGVPLEPANSHGLIAEDTHVSTQSVIVDQCEADEHLRRRFCRQLGTWVLQGQRQPRKSIPCLSAAWSLSASGLTEAARSSRSYPVSVSTATAARFACYNSRRMS
jgi:hypothetical protein